MSAKTETPAASDKMERVRELADRVNRLERSLTQYVIDTELDEQRKRESKLALIAILFGFAMGLWLGRRMLEES